MYMGVILNLLIICLMILVLPMYMGVILKIKHIGYVQPRAPHVYGGDP